MRSTTFVEPDPFKRVLGASFGQKPSQNSKKQNLNDHIIRGLKCHSRSCKVALCLLFRCLILEFGNCWHLASTCVVGCLLNISVVLSRILVLNRPSRTHFDHALPPPSEKYLMLCNTASSPEIGFPERISAGFYNWESFKIGPPAGQKPAGVPILRLPRAQSGRNAVRKPDFCPGRSTGVCDMNAHRNPLSL